MMSLAGSTDRQLPGASAAFGNALILGVLASWATLHAYWPEIYYGSVSEDAILEWMTSWSLAIASVAFFMAGLRQFREGKLPWFLVGLGLFCFVFAMEEISWGQRLLGYRPPEYFLTENYQQELTLHNLTGRPLRNGLFRAIIIGYGVGLPLAKLLKPLARLLDRTGVMPPPWELAPSFIAMAVIHFFYPWSFTGEVIEATLGLAFMVSAFGNYGAFVRDAKLPLITTLAASAAAVTFLSAGSALWYQSTEASDPAQRTLRARGQLRRLALGSNAPVYASEPKRRAPTKRAALDVTGLDREGG